MSRLFCLPETDYAPLTCFAISHLQLPKLSVSFGDEELGPFGLCETWHRYKLPGGISRGSLLLIEKASERTHVGKDTFGKVAETSVEYHHHDEIDNESALHWVNYILDRDACRNGKGKGSFNFVREWLRYVISQRDVYIGLWRWNLNNRNLHAQGMFGVGVKISTLEPRAEMELRLTRLY
eukprot:scaffold6342_cov206-Alexandrium_tamarense.AAC.6